MSKTVKKVGALNLKAMIEEDKLYFNDYEIISKISKKSKSYIQILIQYHFGILKMKLSFWKREVIQQEKCSQNCKDILPFLFFY